MVDLQPLLVAAHLAHTLKQLDVFSHQAMFRRSDSRIKRGPSIQAIAMEAGDHVDANGHVQL